jgi:hypothetical protein
MVSSFEVELPGGDSPAVRQAVIGGGTLFILVTAEDREGGLCCAVLAFDLRQGVLAGQTSLGYIKFDNGGGTLSVAPGGGRVAVGSEFCVTVYDYVDARFDRIADLEADDQSTRPGLFVDSDRIVRSGERRFLLVDLRSKQITEGPQDERIDYDFVIEPDGRHLLVAENRTLHRVNIPALQIVSSHRHGFSVLGDPMVDRWNRAYVFSGHALIQLDLSSGQERVLAERLSTPLCLRLEQHRVAIVDAKGLTSVGLEQGITSYTPFAAAICGAACDESGQFWLISERRIERMPHSDVVAEHVSVSCRPMRY